MKKNEKTHILKSYLNEEKEKNWDNRFTTLKIKEYDSYKDINYLSLGLIKAKIKYEKNEEKLLKRALSKKESGLNNKLHLNSAKTSSNFFHNKRIKSNSSLNKLTPRIDTNIKYNNNISGRNKKYEFYKTIPNSCKKSKNNKPNQKFENIFTNDVKIKIENDEDINELYTIIKELWDYYGVTYLYQNKFLLSLKNYISSKKLLYDLLNIERNNMIKFKNEYSLVINKIEQRNNEINNLKKLIKEYGKKSNKSIKNLEYDIKNNLKLIRIYTINLVSQIKKFFLINSYMNISNKIDLKKIKTENYNFDYRYLSKIKNDLNFLKFSSINTLYNFNNIENDPFLLSLSNISEDEKNVNNEPKYDTLPITNEVYNQIIKLIFFMNQNELNEKIEKENEKIFINHNNYIHKEKNYSENFLTSDNELDIGNNYKGNINQVINQLKTKNNYENIFLNNISNFNKKKRKFDKLKTLNLFLKNDRNNKITDNKDFEEKLPLTTSNELQNQFKQYEKIKQIIEDELNEKNNI